MTAPGGPDRAVPTWAVDRLRAAGCVFAEDEARLLADAASSPEELARLVGERAGGRPLEQVLGWAAFAGLQVDVVPGVFVPRRRSELVVDLARSLATPGDVVVDLCCGSGALGLAVATAVPVTLHAADVDPEAIALAARNLASVGGRAHRGDLYDALPTWLRGTVDLVVVNAPYVPSAELALLPREARVHEPRHALDGGPDGLDLHRRVAAGAGAWLAPAGHLVLETSRHQAGGTRAACVAAGLDTTLHRDPARDATAVVATRTRGCP